GGAERRSRGRPRRGRPAAARRAPEGAPGARPSVAVAARRSRAAAGRGHRVPRHRSGAARARRGGDVLGAPGAVKVMPFGVRGSSAAPGPATARYGGNTACVRVTGADGTVIVLDAGTGIRSLAQSLPPGLQRVDVLLSHLHMDHIVGLGFFGPLYNPGMEVHLWGPASATLTLEARLRRYLAPPLFPVLLRDLSCRLGLHHVNREGFSIGPFRVRAARVCHPGPTVGYRLETDDGSLAYL